MSKSRSQGKGSTYRKVDKGRYDIEYDRIFGHKKNTKAYTRARLCNNVMVQDVKDVLMG